MQVLVAHGLYKGVVAYKVRERKRVGYFIADIYLEAIVYVRVCVSECVNKGEWR